MVLIGAITWVCGILLFIIQIVAGIVAAKIVQALFQGDLAVSTKLGGGTTIAQGVFIEFILIAQLLFIFFKLAAENHTGVFWTSGSLNPTLIRSCGCHSQIFTLQQWIYWAGTLCGSLLAVLLYALVKSLEYQSLNPDPELGPTAPKVSDAKDLDHQKSLVDGEDGAARV
ncbi:hypothetical protein ABVK25_001117 [Lepraria finkii]|uniref:Uncharacterized protein n=1 Tax=Lepraria finkii TaxID=1340010 RepID=A0ABR4BKP6_9LECA